MPPVNDHRDGPRDECGVFGIYAPDHDVARLTYFALFALQHRGQESAGIATAPYGGSIMAIRDQGLVSQVFNEHTLAKWNAYRGLRHEFDGATGVSVYRLLPGVVENTFGFESS